MNNDVRTRKISIHIQKIASTFNEVGEYMLPNDIVESYLIYYKGVKIGQFWLSNNYEDSLQLFVPLDVPLVEYILGEIRARKFLEKDLTHSEGEV
jgi:hypothetical protein